MYLNLCNCIGVFWSHIKDLHAQMFRHSFSSIALSMREYLWAKEKLANICRLTPNRLKQASVCVEIIPPGNPLGNDAKQGAAGRSGGRLG